MRKAKRTALCGMTAALSVVLMLLTSLLPFLTYVVPIITGFLVLSVADFADKKWALGVYFTASALSLLVLTDKEAALTYILFFGYYPIIKEPLEKLPKILAWVCKLALYNAAVIGIGVLGVYLFGVSGEDYADLGKFTIPIYLVLANTVFLLYDFAFTKNLPSFRVLFKRFVKKVM